MTGPVEASGLVLLRRLRVISDQTEEELVAVTALAREQGASWQQIGDAFGITRQSAHARWAKR